mmetsp:Transcript_55968/g.117098  ORF Transcript_55968/g.117098 Transcript_55968/m.117098 type:complete len:209 (-) Transcript_55968:242-868(-)
MPDGTAAAAAAGAAPNIISGGGLGGGKQRKAPGGERRREDETPAAAYTKERRNCSVCVLRAKRSADKKGLPYVPLVTNCKASKGASNPVLGLILFSSSCCMGVYYYLSSLLQFCHLEQARFCSITSAHQLFKLWSHNSCFVKDLCHGLSVDQFSKRSCHLATCVLDVCVFHPSYRRSLHSIISSEFHTDFELLSCSSHVDSAPKTVTG